MIRLDELKAELAKEKAELCRNEEAIKDQSIRNITMFLDKAATHRARINELDLAIESLSG